MGAQLSAGWTRERIESEWANVGQTTLEKRTSTPLPPRPSTPTHDAMMEGEGDSWAMDTGDKETTFIPPPFPDDVREDAINFGWLRDPRCAGICVPVRQVSSDDSTPFQNNREEIVEVSEDGEQVKVRWINRDRWLKTTHVRAIRAGPRTTNFGPKPLVTAIRPEDPKFGQIYAVDMKTDEDIIILLTPGQRYVSKKHPRIPVCIKDWIEVMPRK